MRTRLPIPGTTLDPAISAGESPDIMMELVPGDDPAEMMGCSPVIVRLPTETVVFACEKTLAVKPVSASDIELGFKEHPAAIEAVNPESEIDWVELADIENSARTEGENLVSERDEIPGVMLEFDNMVVWKPDRISWENPVPIIWSALMLGTLPDMERAAVVPAVIDASITVPAETDTENPEIIIDCAVGPTATVLVTVGAAPEIARVCVTSRGVDESPPIVTNLPFIEID